jgi:hypothetical protein
MGADLLACLIPHSCGYRCGEWGVEPQPRRLSIGSLGAVCPEARAPKLFAA